MGDDGTEHAGNVPGHEGDRELLGLGAVGAWFGHDESEEMLSLHYRGLIVETIFMKRFNCRRGVKKIFFKNLVQDL